MLVKHKNTLRPNIQLNSGTLASPASGLHFEIKLPTDSERFFLHLHGKLNDVQIIQERILTKLVFLDNLHPC